MIDIKERMEALEKVEVKSLAEAIDKINKYNELLSVVMYINGGRKAQVVAILNVGPKSIDDIGKELNVNNKNVSSVLSALRKEGYKIGTNSNGCKFFEAEVKVEAKEVIITKKEDKVMDVNIAASTTIKAVDTDKVKMIKTITKKKAVDEKSKKA